MDTTTVEETIGGHLYATPRPTPLHLAVQQEIATQLTPARRSKAWRILPEPEIKFGPDTLVPDLAGWRQEHADWALQTTDLRVSPDWVCEVLSPSTERLDRTKKLRVYLNWNVGWVWLVNPVLQTIEVLRHSGQAYELVATGEVTLPPFDNIELRWSDLWIS